MTIEKKNEIIETLKQDMEGFQIREVEIEKNNQQMRQGICVKREGEKLGAVLYWEDVERILGTDCTKEDAVQYIYCRAVQNLKEAVLPKEMFLWECAKEHVFLKLINWKKNKDRMKELVCSPYLDLLKVCYLSLDMPAGNGTAEVSHDLLQIWGITEEELFWQAEKNAEKEGYEVRFLRELLEGLPLELPKEEVPLKVIQNREQTYGAGILGNLKFLKKVLGEESYYILPSSKHELLLYPFDEETRPEDLRSMVQEVNATVVSENDFLSDNIYLYDKKYGIIFIGEK